MRFIPKLDIKSNNLVKGCNLEGLRVLGKPEVFAKYYYDNGADELIYQDVVASLFGRNALYEIITKTAKEVFIPLTVGGGISSLDDVKKILRCGADKVAINTAAIKNPSLIKDMAHTFGSSTIVLSIEAMRESDGCYTCYTDNGRNPTGKSVVDWVKEACSLGVGEVLLTSINNEGTGRGIDLDLVESVSQCINVPLIVHGGVGKKEHVTNLYKNQNTSISGFALASLLHYECANRFFKDETIIDGNVDFLTKNRMPKSIQPCSISELKVYCRQKGMQCRLEDVEYV